MRSGAFLWAAFLVLGTLLWLESIGGWSHPAYRLALMIGVLSWAGYVVRSPHSG